MIYPLARASDPPTSEAAALSMVGEAHRHRDRILVALRTFGEGHVERIAVLCNLTSHAAGKRLVELERLGLAVPTGATWRLSSGRQGRVWRAVTT